MQVFHLHFIEEETSLSPPEPITYCQCHNEQQLQSDNIHPVIINCRDKKNVQVHCDDTYTYMICEDLSDDCVNSQQNYGTISIECDCECDEHSSKSRTTPTSGEVKHTLNSCSNSTTVAVMGAVLCLLLLLLVVVTSTLVWTCWLLKKRGGLMLSSDRPIR